jgi:hypothetical protein
MKHFLWLLLFVSVVVCADTWTIQFSATDPTPAGAEYDPVYHGQCQVDAVQAYEDLTLVSPDFSTPLIFDVGQVLECRMRAENQLGSILGNWTAWTAGVIATMPQDLSTVIMIQIHHTP